MKLPKELRDKVYNAYSRIYRICESQRYWDQARDIVEKEVKEDRRRNSSLKDEKFGDTCDRLMVNWVLDFLSDGLIPKSEDFFALRHGMFGTYAAYFAKKEQIIAEFSSQEIQDILKGLSDAQSKDFERISQRINERFAGLRKD